MRTSLLLPLALAIASFAALRVAHAQTPANQIQIRTGFAVERVYVPKSQGSWVAMCFDDKGRIYVSS